MANENARPQRGTFLTVMTVLFMLLAISDFAKPIQFGHPNAASGIVELGRKFHGVMPNLILGTLFGILFLVYAYGLWNLRSWVLPIAIGYAFYVPYNVVLFTYREPPVIRSIPFIVIWLAVASTGSIGTAIYIAYNHNTLR
jgi:hypothetical protein